MKILMVMIIIRVAHFDQTIISITTEGITYQTDDQQTAFIDFQGCYDNYAKKHPHILKYPKEKKVGERNIVEQFVEMTTVPTIRFEFDNRDDWYRFVHTIRRLRWSTYDLT